jgi:hypothetical protein
MSRKNSEFSEEQERESGLRENGPVPAAADKGRQALPFEGGSAMHS